MMNFTPGTIIMPPFRIRNHPPSINVPEISRSLCSGVDTGTATRLSQVAVCVTAEFVDSGGRSPAQTGAGQAEPFVAVKGQLGFWAERHCASRDGVWISD
jgi:hypothetical protein